MGAFPTNKSFAEQLINMSTVLASMVGADKIITRTREESSGIPTTEANPATVASTQYTFGILNGLPLIVYEKLHIVEENLKVYLLNFYQKDIEGKEDIKNLYEITTNQIYSYKILGS